MTINEKGGISAVEDLMAQRDAILFGKWVPRLPVEDGEACTIVRTAQGKKFGLGGLALAIVVSVIRDRIPTEGCSVGGWNDQLAQGEEEVLEVLDEAIRRAKELE